MDNTNSKNRIFILKCLQLTDLGIFIIILISLALRLRLIPLLNINEDEFTFLSMVYRYLHHAQLSPFFTFHVHFFSWLPEISGNEVTQIFAARTVMFGLSLGSCIFLYLIGRLFFHRTGSLFSVLCYLSISNVIVHGASFRYDPMCIFLFLCAAYFLLRDPRSLFGLTIAGLSLALSLMVSLKTILYAPTICAIFLLQLFFEKNRKVFFKEILLFSVALIIGFVLLYYFHLSTLAKGSPSADRVVKNLASQGILFKEFFPNWIYAVMIAIENPIVWFYWIAGILLLVWDLVRAKERPLFESLLLLSLIIPIFSLLFYEIDYPYFYVFILSSAIIPCACLIDKISKNFKRNGSFIFFLFVCISSLFIFGNFLFHYKKNAFDQTIAQKQIVEVVHKIFPDPVPYIDRCSMISSYPQAGLKMVTSGMEKYTKANKPIMRNILIKKKPIFILANSVNLDLSVPRGIRKDIYKNYPLLKEDYNILKKNFIHYWGPLYVAGKHFDFDSTRKTQTFKMLIPGTYTLLTDGAVSINGVIYEPESEIKFAQMSYTIVPKTFPMEVTLRWGKDLYKPSQEPSTQPIFLGYYW